MMAVGIEAICLYARLSGLRMCALLLDEHLPAQTLGLLDFGGTLRNADRKPRLLHHSARPV